MFFFLHIPKTAGTSFRKLISESLPRNSFFWHGSDGFLKDVSINDLAEKTLIGGHVTNQSKRVVQLENKLGRENMVYVSILREPIERLASHFAYVAARPQHPLHSGTTLAEALTEGTAFYEAQKNLQCSYFTPSRRCDDALEWLSQRSCIIGRSDRLELITKTLFEHGLQTSLDFPVENSSNSKHAYLLNEEILHDYADRFCSEDKWLYDSLEESGIIIRKAENAKQKTPTKNQTIKQSAPKPTYIHIHIAKTAGTTLNAVVAKNYQQFEKFAYQAKNHSAFIQSPYSHREKYRFVFGHMRYGLHQYLRAPYLYLFVLRKPAERIYSYYKYLFTREDHPDYSKIGGKCLDFDSFLKVSEFDSSLNKAIDNRMCRALSGLSDKYKGPMEYVFQHALTNALADTSLFGLTEDMPAYYARLQSAGVIVDAPQNLRLNTTESRTSFDSELKTISSYSRDLLEKYTLWDKKLYERCKESLNS